MRALIFWLRRANQLPVLVFQTECMCFGAGLDVPLQMVFGHVHLLCFNDLTG